MKDHLSTWVLIAAFILSLGLVVPGNSHGFTFTTIDAGGAGTGAGGINSLGQIVGTVYDYVSCNFEYCYLDSPHGFLWESGRVTRFDVPGASETYATGINGTGQIVGSFWDVNRGRMYGFLKNGDTFTTIDIQGAFSTWLGGINSAGQIVGSFSDGYGVHGFLKNGDTFITIDIQGASATYATGINDTGQTVGYYLVETAPRVTTHGFLWVSGTVTTIEVPGADGTAVYGINGKGQIVGSFWDATGTHGFLKDGDTFTVIDVPDLPPGVDNPFTSASGLNNTGQIVGSVGDLYEPVMAGFLSAPTFNNAPPSASFTFTCSALTCGFDGSASSDLDGTITSYLWNFGDGTSAGRTVNHTYATPGAYTVTLRVIDNAGALATTSQSVNVTTSVAAPVLGAISPTTVAAGAGGLTLTATGQNFLPTSVVRVNGSARATTYGSASSLTASIPASDLADAGALAITVATPAPCAAAVAGYCVSAPQTLTVTGPTLTATPLQAALIGPVTVSYATGPGRPSEWVGMYPAGSPNGIGGYIDWQWVSSTNGTLYFPTGSVAKPAGAYVFRWISGSRVVAQSGTVTLMDIPPAPVRTSLDPSSVVAGSPSFTLRALGGGFRPSSVVRVNGVDRASPFLSTGELTTTIAASEVITVGTTLSVAVYTPPALGAGGGLSAMRTLAVITGPTLTAAPTQAPLTGPVTVSYANGPGHASEWVGMYPLTSTGIGGYIDWQWTAGTSGSLTFPTGAAARPAGTYVFRWISGGVIAQSAPVTLAALSATPSITSLSPASVSAGSAAFTLTLNGTGFVNGATATLGGAPRAVTFVSSAQVTIAVQAADVATIGTVAVVVTNPAPCVATACVSNAAQLAVTSPPPAPVLNAISPSTAAAGGAAFTLTATGQNFVPTSVVQVNGNPRATGFVSSTTLTANVGAAEIAGAGALSITVVTPPPGGGTSISQTLTVTGPALSVNPATGPPGTEFTVTLQNWAGGASDWLTIAPAGAANTTYGPWVYVSSLSGAGGTRTWRVTLATLGTFEARLFLNNGFTRAATSPSFAVANINLTPVISGLSPASVAAGTASLTLTVNGSGFASGATATVGGVARAVTFVSAAQVTIAVQAADVATIGTVAVVVTNPAPCMATGCMSNAAELGVLAPPPAPVLAAISPSSAPAGGPAFTLTATGQNFVPASVVQVNGAARATTYDSPTQLRATILAGDVGSSGSVSITVFTPAPGGGTSGAQTLQVTGPGLVASPATGQPGSPLTITLTNWSGGSWDWLALAPVGAANTSYLTYVYVGSLPGAGGTKTWTTTMPATLGQYEVRLFLNNGYTRAATSNAIIVTASP